MPGQHRVQAKPFVAVGILLTLAVLLHWQISLIQRRVHDLNLAYASATEALSQARQHHLALATHVLHVAEASLGMALTAFSRTTALNVRARAVSGLSRLAGIGVIGSSLTLDVLVAAGLGAAVGLYWYYERALTRRDRERQDLEQKLLDVNALLVSASNDLGQIKEVIAHILIYLVESRGLQSALVVRWHPDRPEDALEPYAFSGPTLPWKWEAVPGMFLDPDMSGLGQTIHQRVSWVRTGMNRSAKPLLPGWNIPWAGAYPVVVDAQVFGALVVIAKGPRWASTDDVFTRTTQHLGNLMAQMERKADAGRVRVYQELARMQSELLAQVSHELRTPLGLMKGYAATLETRFDDLSVEERQEFLATILEEADRLGLLIDQILKMSSIDAHGVAPTPRLMRLDRWLADLVRRFPPGERTRLAVRADPTTRFWGDPELLADVVLNLLQNALKYSHRTVEVTAGHHERTVRMVVRDYGPGVAERDLTRIFERFYRGTREVSAPVSGAGLGLSIARQIVEAHHGRIYAENAGGGGLAVTVELPMADVTRGEA